MVTPAANKELTIRLITPEKVEWEGKAIALSSKNPIGPFSLLPGHAQFISTIEEFIEIYTSVKEPPKTFSIKNGLIHCHKDEIEIFIKLPFGLHHR